MIKEILEGKSSKVGVALAKEMFEELVSENISRGYIGTFLEENFAYVEKFAKETKTEDEDEAMDELNDELTSIFSNLEKNIK